MSRISYDDDWDVETILAHGRWQRNTVQTLNSKRGQAVLREIEAALLALPQKRLAYETFCKVEESDDVPEGIVVDACVLGALTWHRGRASAVPEVFNDRDNMELELPAPYYEPTARDEAEWAEKNLGMAYTLAWNLIEQNDEFFGRATPESRYDQMLTWVRERITPESKPTEAVGVVAEPTEEAGG